LLSGERTSTFMQQVVADEVYQANSG